MPNKGITSSLLYYMQQNAGRAVTIDELVREHTQFERHQILSGMSTLRRETPEHIKSLRTGVYQYEFVTDSESVDRVTFRVIKSFDEGMILIDADNNVYKAVFLA